ncbi:MAG: SF0329 family protein [Cognatishimia sp.]|uniref:SF0329 family protein n=1 Tax=Cognatishimia sp. TaxID=2211648 RepID=UPI0040592F42
MPPDSLRMRWSKLKQRIEAGFADSAKGRVEIWSTRYRKSHDQEGEAWITIDGQRVYSMGSLTYLVEWYERSSDLQEKRGCLDFRDCEKIDGYRDAQMEVAKQLHDEGVMSLGEFNGALFDYLNMSVNEILSSDQMIVRALGMFDRRLGKRRLSLMNVSDEPELIQGFYRVRCAFEGISIRSASRQTS